MNRFHFSGSVWSKMNLAARVHVRDELRKLKEATLDDVMSAAGISADRRRALQRLLEIFSDEAEICLLAIPPETKLGDVFRVSTSGLLQAINGEAGADPTLPEQFEAFGNDLLYALETASSASGWANQWSTLTGSPSNDDDRLDALMAMSLLEFIRFATPMLRP